MQFLNCSLKNNEFVLQEKEKAVCEVQDRTCCEDNNVNRESLNVNAY
jgi:hypothetical protein